MYNYTSALTDNHNDSNRYRLILLFQSIILQMLYALFSNLRAGERAKQIFTVSAAVAFLQKSLIDNSQSSPQSLRGS